MERSFRRIYDLLSRRFGRQNWWPAETPFEMMTGAILTQNTSWRNVERAIDSLRQADALSPRKMYQLSRSDISRLIRPAGFHSLKADRLMNLLTFFRRFGYSARRLGAVSDVRERLLSVKGVGPETADSIMLYALGIPVFIVDAYTKRLFSRVGMIDSERISYDELQALVHRHLPPDGSLYGEYHALIVTAAKHHCRKVPRCGGCALERICRHRAASAGERRNGQRNH